MSLKKLEMLRNRRIEQSFVELQANRKIAEDWQNHCTSQENNLVNFEQWRLNYQEQLFKNLLNQSFNPQALVDYRATLEQMQQQEQLLRTELAQTYQSLQRAQQQVAVAQKKSAEANVKLEKVKEIISIENAKKPREEPAQ